MMQNQSRKKWQVLAIYLSLIKIISVLRVRYPLQNSMNYELIANQFANLIDAMCYYSVPAKLWDGTEYPAELDEPTEALRKTGKVEYFLRVGSEYEQRPTEVVIPNSLLSKASELIAMLEDLKDD